MQFNYSKNINLNIIIISTIIFFIKWFFSFYEYGLESLFVKFLFNPSGDYSYFPFVHQLSNLSFNEGYSAISNKNNLIGFPFLVILFHAIFYKIFGLFGFFIIEFFCIFIFIKIFFEIFKIIKFGDNFSLTISVFLFSLLPIVDLLYEFNIPYTLNLKNLYTGFYSLRFPRPLITNLFFFSFILYSIKYFVNSNNKNKNFLIISVFLGFMLNSFFYFFIVCALLTLFLFFFQYKFDFFNKEKIFLLGKFVSILLVLSSIFLIQIIYIENDYFARIGTLDLLPETKIYLFKHLIKGFSKIEFWLILLINLFFYFLNIRLNQNYKKFIIYFFLLFFSSILSPFIFLSIMNKVTFFSNFIFIITLSSLLLLKINVIIFLKIIFEKFKIEKTTFISGMVIFLMLVVNGLYFKKNSKIDILSEGVHFDLKNKTFLRKDLIELINFSKKKIGKNYLLLTNDLHTQLWWIFSNEKKFYFPYVFFISLSDKLIEKQLFNAFKILKFDENEFIDFFNQNKITNWRVVNTNNYFFLGHLKYQANYLTAINNIQDYPMETQKFIEKKTIHLTNQVILNNHKKSLLKENYKSYKMNPKLEPDLIILLKNDFMEKNVSELKNYELTFENKNYLVMEKVNN